MTQTEKARAYDEALERARKLKENPQSVFNEYSPKEGDTICDYIFPELKESEDERIRKELIDYHRSMAAQADDYVHEAWIAWLEKQGEQKPAWSEEDDVMIKVFDSIIRYIVEAVDKDVLERFGTNREELFSWLKSLKQRMGG